MNRSEENPVSIEQARKLLGAPGEPWPRARLTAIKKAMGITSRWFFVSEVRKWMRDHPNFKVRNWQGRAKETADRNS